MGFKDIKHGADTVFNSVINLLNQSIGYAAYSLYGLSYGLMGRPIGMVSKNYHFTVGHLNRNRGNWQDSNGEKIGTPIGLLADKDFVEFNHQADVFDIQRNNYYDYVNYIENVYYKDGGKRIVDINTEKPRNLNYIELYKPENQTVGVARKVSNLMRSDELALSTNTSSINPNYYGEQGPDTRLGVISGYYMTNNMLASVTKGKELGYNAYLVTQESTNAVNNEKNLKTGSSITKGIYSKFGVLGEYGLQEGKSILSDTAVPNSFLSGQIIPWSTSDHVYDSDPMVIKDDLSRVRNILGGSVSDYSLEYNDLAQGTTLDTIYAPFGNYYSITYSLGLVSTSGARTQKYIANSMLGIPLTQAKDEYVRLLDEQNYTVDSSERRSKYYVGNGTRGTNYLDMMTGSVVDFIKYNGTTNKNIVRLNIQDAGNDNMFSANIIYQHLEAEGGVKLESPKISPSTFNGGVAYGKYAQYDPTVISSRPDIINKTNKLFSDNKIKSIIGRFHTDEYSSKTDARAKKDYTSTAVSKYGMSRGRNLLKRNHVGIKDNGYSNPYCRVWTYHHEYATLQDMIRPFYSNGNVMTLSDTEVARYRTPATNGTNENGWESGQNRLERYTARTKTNNLVRFAPSMNQSESIKSQLKRLMFSIENLAWVGDTNGLDIDQIGPLGGRIMWFPPYNLEFHESVSTNWNETEFIGRGEKIPTYINTSRGGTLSFDILIDHPSVVNSYVNAGVGGEGIGDVDDTESNEQMLLRFFAGCEMLGKTTDTVTKENDKNDPTAPFDTTIIAEENEEVFSFFVFFPNNYSGIDDIDLVPIYAYSEKEYDTKSSLKNFYPVQYLLHGDYAGIYENKETHELRNSIINIGFGQGYEVNNEDGISKGCTYPTEIDVKTTEEEVNGQKFEPKAYTSSNNKTTKWGYRVDKRTDAEQLGELNYVDNECYFLNSNQGLSNVISNFGVEDKTKCFSFTEAFLAITDSVKEAQNGDLGSSLIFTSDSDDNNYTKATKLKTILDELKNDELTVVVSGYASGHGHANSNSQLSRDRAVTLKKWLSLHPQFKNITIGATITSPFEQSQSVNSQHAKLGRAARVQVFKPKEKVSEPLNTDFKNNINAKDNKNENSLQEAQYLYDNGEHSIEENNSIYTRAASGDTKDLRLTTNVEARQRELTQKLENGYLRQDDLYKASAELMNKTKDIEMNGAQDKLGYHNEYRFFRDLDKTEPFLHNKLVDKFKFFDPAFHSITPEGYQARLTFLHQCTRQGRTSAWTDNTSMASAANLAFGRPPILVLRVGDFYNTKIAVTSLTIQFKNSQGMQWDLNDEGIGIMPMYASISMNFNFYGGSDLGGPVSRLQNAVSFNYYANTSVYDDRAEMVEYGEDGKLTRMKVNEMQ